MMNFNTSLLHAGEELSEKYGSTLAPIYQNTAFRQNSAEELENIFCNRSPGYCYTRVANPTITALENRINKIEGGLGTIATSSGMSAIFNAVTNIVESGEEIVSSASLYGGTIDLFKDLEAFGIKTVYVENNNFESYEAAITDRTRLIFCEMIGNPCLDVTDVDKLAEIAHKHGLPLVVDNTVATAYLFKAIEHGADVVVNSTSKYINGNSNSIGGALTYSGKFKFDKEKYKGIVEFSKFGPFAYIAKLRNGLFRNSGACMSPNTAYMNLIGIETMGLRMERACSNALELARHLENNYREITVNYPGLESSKWHEVAKRELSGGFGAILTIRVGSKENAFKLINELKLAYKASNIGDTKTLVLHPASTISLHSTPKQQEDAGVFDDLIRVSVGIEDIEDLKADFDQAIAKINEENKNG